MRLPIAAVIAFGIRLMTSPANAVPLDIGEEVCLAMVPSSMEARSDSLGLAGLIFNLTANQQ